jgi:murein DD-endopeptidase MepM/ murein hydrolase activator NlpD
MNRRELAAGFAMGLYALNLVCRADELPAPTLTPTRRAVDLDVGESSRIRLADGSTANVRLKNVEATSDPIRHAVRSARVSVEINGESATLGSGNYELPKVVGGVQVDCPVVGDYRANSSEDHWGLEKAARLRFWPLGTPWIEPGTFVYPARQRWFASLTQMANEPVFVDGGESPKTLKIYYHSGLDIGGAEGMVEVVAATDGVVISSGNDRLPGYEKSPVNTRYDVVYLLDKRGWFYRYSHMQTIDSAMKPGATVKMGQRLGVLGKEGGSGGWSHLHFEIKSRQPSGKWGTEEGYAFLWASALRQQGSGADVVAVARPHHFVRVGDSVVLDGSKSWCRSGQPTRFEWSFSDGSTATGPRVERAYRRAGSYCETLKVTDSAGHVGFDFAIVQVFDPAQPENLSPSIHAAYFPTTGLKVGAEVTFKVRTFRVGRDGGSETWDFGDGSAPVSVRSDGNVAIHARDGYATVTHRFARPGDYLVKVERADRQGLNATARLHVRVD